MNSFLTKNRDLVEMFWVSLVLMVGTVLILATGMLMIKYMAGPVMPTRSEVLGDTLRHEAKYRAQVNYDADYRLLRRTFQR